MQPDDRIADHPVMDAGILHGVHLLEADAGTGKTWTITGIVLRALIERRLPIGSVLAVTFTNAAVAELRLRIRRGLERLLADLQAMQAAGDTSIPLSGDPFCEDYAARLLAAAVVDPSTGAPVEAGVARDLLRQALAQIDELAVYTIHGYCQRVLTEQTLTTDAPSRLVFEGDGRPQLERMVADWWHEQVSPLPAEHLQSLDLLGIGLPLLQAALVKRLKHVDALLLPVVQDWRALLRRIEDHRLSLKAALARHGDDLLAAVSAGKRGPCRINGQVMRATTIARRLDELRRWCADGPYFDGWPQDAFKALAVASFERAGADLQAVQRLRIPPGCADLVALGADLDGLLAGLVDAAARDVLPRLQQALVDRGVLDFDALLRMTRDALRDPVRGPRLAERLRQRHPLALVDECQDTDAVQWEVLQRIYPFEPRRDGDASGLILVGDPKQAIYAFRGADVYAYLAVRDGWPARDGSSCVPQLHRLGENQRSVPPLIDAVNALFESPGAFLVREIGFHPAAVGRRPRVPLEAADATRRAALCWVDLCEASGAPVSSADEARSLAARATAAEIARLLAFGRTRLGARALQPSDIAVLVHANTEAGLMRRELQRYGLNAAQLSRDNVLTGRDGDELLRLIAAIGDPADPGLLKGALLTAFLGAGHDDLDRAVLHGAPWFAQAGLAWRDHGPQRAMRDLLEHFDVFTRLAGGNDGERRLTNLLHLLELLGAATEAAAGPLQAQRWLERLRAQAADSEALEVRLDSDDNLIRIVTVHRSKGLEYPIVFVPFGWRPAAAVNARQRPPFAQAFQHRREGNGWVSVLDLSLQLDAAALAAVDEEQRAQSLRLAYVALTRAVQRCYLFDLRSSRHERSPWGFLLSVAEGAPDDEAIARIARRAHGGLRCLTAAQLLEDIDDPAHGGRHRHDAALHDDSTPSGAAQAFPARAALPPPPGLRAAALKRLPATAWRRSSFSAIHHGLQRSGSEPGDDGDWVAPEAMELEALAALSEVEPDERVATDSQPLPGLATGQMAVTQAAGNTNANTSSNATDDITGNTSGNTSDIRERFAAGSRAGTCLHEILEQALIRDDVEAGLTPAVVADVLDRQGFAAEPADELAIWLTHVVRTPLPQAGPRLRDLQRADRFTELEFNLRVAGMDTAAMVDIVRSVFPFDGAAASQHWQGYLQGFIDLVFRHEGRYFIVDWKSNRLGNGAADYASAGLSAAMREHAYPLQFSLYTLALHRHLRQRLAGYDPVQHLGGVHYVFLRGVGRPGADPSGGIVHAQVPLSLIDTLDRLFGGGPQDAVA